MLHDLGVAMLGRDKEFLRLFVGGDGRSGEEDKDETTWYVSGEKQVSIGGSSIFRRMRPWMLWQLGGI